MVQAVAARPDVLSDEIRVVPDGLSRRRILRIAQLRRVSGSTGADTRRRPGSRREGAVLVTDIGDPDRGVSPITTVSEPRLKWVSYAQEVGGGA